MPVVINGTTGISTPDGSASVPPYTGSSGATNGLYFPTATTAAISTNGTNALYIDSSQNVGIGTITPAGKVSVSYSTNTAYNGGLAVTNLNSGSGAVAAFQLTNDAGNRAGFYLTSSTCSYYGGANTANFGTVDSIPLTFLTANSERMRIDSIGGVGIGTSTPTAYGFYNLVVYKAGANTGMTIAADAGLAPTLAFSKGTTGTQSYDGYIQYNNPSSAMIFATSATERMRIDSSGNLLVGTNDTSVQSGAGFKFIQGGGSPYMGLVGAASTGAANSYHLYSTGAGAYRFYVSYGGQVNATITSINGISDQRLKENIVDLDIGLDAILSLKPRKFDWKEGKGKDIKGDRGFIAQEFEKVFPDLVGEWLDPAPEGEEPYKSVRQDLIPVIVRAVQELSAKLDAAEARITALEGVQ